MKRNLFICAALLMIFAGLIFAADMDGNWKGTVQSPMGDMPLTFTFQAVGDSLTGTVQSEMGANEILNGKIDGKNFTFDTQFQDFTMTHNCTIEGDSIIVKVPGMGGEEMNMILKKSE